MPASTFYAIWIVDRRLSTTEHTTQRYYWIINDEWIQFIRFMRLFSPVSICFIYRIVLFLAFLLINVTRKNIKIPFIQQINEIYIWNQLVRIPKLPTTIPMDAPYEFNGIQSHFFFIPAEPKKILHEWLVESLCAFTWWDM